MWQRLYWRFSLFVLATSVGFGVLMGLVHAYGDYRSALKRLEADAAKILRTLKEPVRTALERGDEELAVRIGLGLLDVDFVSGLRINDREGVLLADVKKHGAQSLQSTWPFDPKPIVRETVLQSRDNKTEGTLRLIVFPHPAVAQFRGRLLFDATITLVGGVCLALLVLLLFRYAVSRPLARLADAFENIDLDAGRLDTSIKVAEYPNNEIGRVAIAGENLRNALSQRAELRDRAARDAEDANRAKSEFLAVMSHELRTPLNAISGFSQVINGQVFGDLGNPKYAEYAKDIALSSDHLISLVNDVLDLTKIESTEIELRPAPFPLLPVINETVSLAVKSSKRNPAFFKVSVAKNFGMLNADVRSFRQIMINLLSNAAKFTPNDGQVEIRASHGPNGSIVVKVEDNGIGIEEQDLERVLEPFGQARAHAEVTHSGTGLGLTISKKIMELGGGSLEISSRVGEGTKITLRFPQTTP